MLAIATLVPPLPLPLLLPHHLRPPQRPIPLFRLLPPADHLHRPPPHRLLLTLASGSTTTRIPMTSPRFRSALLAPPSTSMAMVDAAPRIVTGGYATEPTAALHSAFSSISGGASRTS